jgi:hypothetical protein
MKRRLLLFSGAAVVVGLVTVGMVDIVGFWVEFAMQLDVALGFDVVFTAFDYRRYRRPD